MHVTRSLFQATVAWSLCAFGNAAAWQCQHDARASRVRMSCGQEGFTNGWLKFSDRAFVNYSCARRKALGSLIAVSVGSGIANCYSASAEENGRNRPTAPLEALVPATQKRMLLKQSLDIANALVEQQRQGCSSEGQCDKLLEKLKKVLEPPGDDMFFKRPAISMTRRYQIDQRTLQNAQANRLSGISMRASMNVYTANLRFGDSYVLTASNEDRRNYIRKYDQLPDVKQVITSDLDLRDLYRNEVQTKIDDAQAELYSQGDAVELQNLLQQANDTCQQWFALISETDVLAAQEAALTWKQTTLELPNQRFSGYNFFS